MDVRQYFIHMEYVYLFIICILTNIAVIMWFGLNVLEKHLQRASIVPLPIKIGTEPFPSDLLI